MTEDEPTSKTKVISALAEFAEFVKKQNVMGLAVGVTVGGATTKLVSSFVDNIINPIIGMFVREGESLSSFVVGPVKLGSFISSLIDFIIVMAVVYVVINKTMQMLTSAVIRKPTK
jgi:large conductance mechanosensitive channel